MNRYQAWQDYFSKGVFLMVTLPDGRWTKGFIAPREVEHMTWESLLLYFDNLVWWMGVTHGANFGQRG